jgi:hypothetical protein
MSVSRNECRRGACGEGLVDECYHQPKATPEATYELEMRIEILRIPPPWSNRAAPELSDVAQVAVEAARRVLVDAGYRVARVGHGSRRTDLP